MIHYCPICKREFKRSYNYYRHMNKIHKDKNSRKCRKQIACDQCNKRFSWPHTLKSHKEKIHGAVEQRKKWQKKCCGVVFDCLSRFRSHCNRQHSETDHVGNHPIVPRYRGTSSSSEEDHSSSNTHRSSLLSLGDTKDIKDLADQPSTSTGRFADPGAAMAVRALANDSSSDDDLQSSEAANLSVREEEEIVIERNENGKFECLECGAEFNRRSTLNHHINLRHKSVSHPRMKNIERPKNFDDYEFESVEEQLKDALESPQSLFKTLSEPVKRKSAKFKLFEMDTEYTLTGLGIFLCEAGFTYEVLEAIVNFLTKTFTRNKKGYIRVCIDATGLDFPISVPAVKVEDFSANFFLNKVESVLTSKATFAVDGTMKLNIVFIEGEKFGGKLRRSHVQTGEAYMRRKRGCWDPKTTDFACIGSCICAALIIRKSAEKDFRSSWWFKRGASQSQHFQEKVNSIYYEIGLNPKKPQAYEDLKKFQTYLNNLDGQECQLIVYDSWHADRIFFQGLPERLHSERIYLSVYENHFYLIYNPKTFFNRDSICEICGRVYYKVSSHSCERQCDLCYHWFCGLSKMEKNPIGCKTCGITYKNKMCFFLHCENRLVCAKRKRCAECGKIDSIQNLETHSCGMKKCKNCKEQVSINHLCQICPPSKIKRKGPDKFLLVVFDLKTYLLKENQTKERSELIPYLATAVVFCENCINNENWEKTCDICGQKRRWFWGGKIKHFCEWLFFGLSNDIPGRPVVAIAHNSSRFDTVFLLSYLLQIGHAPQVVFRGTQCLELKHFSKIRVKDFCTYVAAPLASLPSAFGLQKWMTNFKKGFFPHSFLTDKSLLNYKGCIPEEKFFEPERYKSESRLKEFRDWYHNRKNDSEPYDLKQEAKIYCMQDTEILARSVQRFRTNVMEITENKIDPIIGKSVTVASMVSDIFRTLFLPDHGLGLMPRLGYGTVGRKQSVMALKYLDFLNKKRREQGLSEFVHAGNSPSGEWNIANYKVDAVTNDRKEALEICGCFYHAHSCQYESATKIHPLFGIPFGDVANQTEFRHFLIGQQIRLEIIYECEILKKIEQDEYLRKFWTARSTQRRFANPINVRDALYGGRTESFCLQRKLTENEIVNDKMRIMYLDFVSLYPAVQKKNLFPTALHPKVYTQLDLAEKNKEWNTKNMSQYFGFVSCFILPPEDLLIPVLPCRIRNKCIFTLCYQCAVDNNQTKWCNHCDDDRGLLGCWTTVDILDALMYGYHILEVYEIWDWAYAPLTDQLFAPFVNNIIKQKVESAGCPNGKELEVANDWLLTEGIAVDPEKVARPKNPAMYTTTKIIANSLWGKMAELPRQHKTAYFSEWTPFSKLLQDRTLEITDFNLLNSGRTLCCIYKTIVEDSCESPLHNVFIASLVTAYARRKLNEVLQCLGPRLLYCDTDSVIFTSTPDQWQPRTGCTLGLLSNELGPGEFISRLQVLSPKNYRFEVSLDSSPSGEPVRTEIKCKGQMLSVPIRNSLTAELYERLLEHRVTELADFYDRLLLAGETENAIERARAVFCNEQLKNRNFSGVFVPNPTLIRDKKQGKIFTDSLRVRLLKFSFDKRRLFVEASQGCMQSLPFEFRIPQGK